MFGLRTYLSLILNKCPTYGTISRFCISFLAHSCLYSRGVIPEKITRETTKDTQTNVRKTIDYCSIILIIGTRMYVCNCEEVVHMINNERKQQDIKFIVELLQRESSEKVREILVFIRNYLSK